MSRIEVNLPPAVETERFGYLSAGTPFMFIGGTRLYVKIDEVSRYDSDYQKRDYNIVCLDDGHLDWMDDNLSVVLVSMLINASYKLKED